MTTYTEILKSIKKDDSTLQLLQGLIDNSPYKDHLIVKPIADHYSIQGDLTKVTRAEVFEYFTTEGRGAYKGHFILQ
jgi:acetone carboxylase gamma subunit